MAWASHDFWFSPDLVFDGQIANVLKGGVKVAEVHDTSECYVVVFDDGEQYLKTFDFEDDRIRNLYEVLEAIEKLGFEVQERPKNGHKA